MKTILLAAAAVIAFPAMAIAQDTPQTTTAPDATTAPATTSDPTAPTDPAAAPATDATTADPGTTPQDASTPPPAPATPPATPGGAPGTETAGGYQPSQPAISGTPQPGATVRFQPAPSPDQAFPAPAPKAEYPVCKKGQYDGCLQASDARKPARARRRR
ncbi:MAG: hypothetical protein DI544_06730 [Sphingomonas taxi]|uniref:Fe-S oxidoreductase n=1 Tax=Sphingomonas taxi TaxID=1549858 RepID=A0A2W5R1U4_9SPHN|nr:MAG: hypothetical protein DI544_06730 [Sphingomonas taxi]